MNKALTRETVLLLAQSRGMEFFPPNAQPWGFVRTVEGWISTATAEALVLAGKLDPAANLVAIAKQDDERQQPAIAIEAAAEKQRKSELAELHAQRQHQYEVDQKREAERKEAFDAVAGMRKF